MAAVESGDVVAVAGGDCLLLQIGCAHDGRALGRTAQREQPGVERLGRGKIVVRRAIVVFRFDGRVERYLQGERSALPAAEPTVNV